MDKNYNLTKILKAELKHRNNPKDLKAIVIGIVEQLSPLVVSIAEKKILLKENDELYISEWFKCRCDINKTYKLSDDVKSNLQSAREVLEVHSYNGTDCQMPQAIDLIAQAIEKINAEILALKCDFNIGDYVIVGSLEQADKYILLDKLLDDNYKFYDED